MVYSTYKKQRILSYRSQGLEAPTTCIAKVLCEYGQLSCTRVGVAKFLKKFKETGSLARHSGSGRPSKNTTEIKEVVEQQMQHNDETTAVQLHHLLNDCSYSVLLRTILRCRTSIGWTFCRSAYCQMIASVIPCLLCYMQQLLTFTSLCIFPFMGQNIQRKYMSGLVSAKKDRQECAFSMV